jgi:hypothetical protein
MLVNYKSETVEASLLVYEHVYTVKLLFLCSAFNVCARQVFQVSGNISFTDYLEQTFDFIFYKANPRITFKS